MTPDNLVAFISPREPWGQRVVTPMQRAEHSTETAVEDLDAAIWQAETVAELQAVRVLVEDMIKRLIVSSSVALTLQEHR